MGFAIQMRVAESVRAGGTRRAPAAARNNVGRYMKGGKKGLGRGGCRAWQWQVRGPAVAAPVLGSTAGLWNACAGLTVLLNALWPRPCGGAYPVKLSGEGAARLVWAPPRW